MLVQVRHVIGDSEAFWRIAAEGIAHTPDRLLLHQIASPSAGGDCACLWETDSVDRLRDFMESKVGHVSRNTYEDRTAERLFDPMLSDVIERFALGVILVDRECRALLRNSAATAILAMRDGLSDDDGRLVASSHRDTCAIRNAVTSVAARLAGSAPAVALSIARPSLKRPLSLMAVRMGRATALFISDPESSLCASVELLQTLYGLTPKEAQIAALLVEGSSIEELAERLGISAQTARWHLKNVFNKASAETQRDLIRMILTGPAGLR